MPLDPFTARPGRNARRFVLASTNVGPDANPLYVLRVVDDANAEVVTAEVVDIRGDIVYYAPYFTESGARQRANGLYELFRKHNGEWNLVRDELQS